MTKSELIEQIAMRQPELSAKEVETAVRIILDDMTDALASGGRVELRGVRQLFATLPRASCRAQP